MRVVSNTGIIEVLGVGFSSLPEQKQIRVPERYVYIRYKKERQHYERR
jgi:hypothetical protein